MVIGGYGVSGKGGVELEPLGLSLLMLARMELEMGLETVIPVLLLLVVGRSVEGRGLVVNDVAGSRGSEKDEIRTKGVDRTTLRLAPGWVCGTARTLFGPGSSLDGWRIHWKDMRDGVLVKGG